jgi:hypothetical protein
MNVDGRLPTRRERHAGSAASDGSNLLIAFVAVLECDRPVRAA